MRQLRFRAWDGKKMHYDVFPWKHDFVISAAWHRCEASTGPGPLGSGGDTAVMMVPAVRFTELMQFTGLHDKNGKEIYEGDVVKGVRPLTSRDGRVTGEERFIGAVEYDAWWGAYRRNGVKQYQGLSAALMHGKEMEVIGNIYEHPSLLTAE